MDSIDIDPHVLEHVERKHGLAWEEVEEVCYARRHVQRAAREDTLLIYGQTQAGRYLIVAVADHELAWMIVTARDVDDSERRWYRDARRSS